MFNNYNSFRMMGPTNASFQFWGSRNEHAEEFFYTYVSILMRGKNDEKASSVFAYLSGDARLKYK